MRWAGIAFLCLAPAIAMAKPAIPDLSADGIKVEKLNVEVSAGGEYTILHLRLMNPKDHEILWNWQCVAVRGDEVLDNIALFNRVPPGQSYGRLILRSSAWNGAEQLECY